MTANSSVGTSWDDARHELFTREEIIQSDIRVSIISELVKARNDQGISQKELERMTGVKQPVIARLEKGSSVPRLDTLIKLLAPLGKTLAIVPLETKR